MGDSSGGQFGIVRVLRPFKNFEAVYEGQPSEIPLMFSERTVHSDPGGQPKDSQAGDPGYSPQLIRGLSVPMGSRVSVWIPNIPATQVFPLVEDPYVWKFTWRFRNTFDWRTARKAFHFPQQEPGISDTFGGGPGKPRVVIPAGCESVVYNQPEPPGINQQAIQHLRIEDISSRGYGTTILPLLPDGTVGFYQQGLLDPNGTPINAAAPIYDIYDLVALGDELMIGVYRAAGGPFPTWNFTTGSQEDFLMSALFGNGDPKGPFPECGVYVSCGTVP